MGSKGFIKRGPERVFRQKGVREEFQKRGNDREWRELLCNLNPPDGLLHSLSEAVPAGGRRRGGRWGGAPWPKGGAHASKEFHRLVLAAAEGQKVEQGGQEDGLQPQESLRSGHKPGSSLRSGLKPGSSLRSGLKPASLWRSGLKSVSSEVRPQWSTWSYVLTYSRLKRRNLWQHWIISRRNITSTSTVPCRKTRPGLSISLYNKRGRIKLDTIQILRQSDSQLLDDWIRYT